MGKGLIPADLETWKPRRRAIVPAFHKAYLQACPGALPLLTTAQRCLGCITPCRADCEQGAARVPVMRAAPAFPGSAAQCSRQRLAPLVAWRLAQEHWRLTRLYLGMTLSAGPAARVSHPC